MTECQWGLVYSQVVENLLSVPEALSFVPSISRKTKENMGIHLPKDPATSLLGIYPNDAPSYHKDSFSPMFIAILFVVVRNWK